MVKVAGSSYYCAIAVISRIVLCTLRVSTVESVSCIVLYKRSGKNITAQCPKGVQMLFLYIGLIEVKMQSSRKRQTSNDIALMKQCLFTALPMPFFDSTWCARACFVGAIKELLTRLRLEYGKNAVCFTAI